MKITLINVSSKLTSDGSRLVSALLKRAGHHVNTVFLARSEPLTYEKKEFEPLDEMLLKSDLVMVAVYSSYAARAVQLTEYVHEKFPGMKVIWGGPHCISAPDFSLRHADAVCFSEGDEVIVDMVNSMESGNGYLSTPNMAFKSNGSPIVNDVLDPFQDLDNLPYYDYHFEDHFLLDSGLFQMTKEIFREGCSAYPYYIPTFYFLTSRGCPNRCSYCNNCRFVSMFGRNPLRFQSPKRVVDEMKNVLESMDFIRLVGFGDDDFFTRPLEQLEDFASRYKVEIGLPFGVAVSANTYTQEKMEILVDAGLKFIQMGVESGSQRMLDDVYDRKIRVTKTKEVVRQIEDYRKKKGLEFFLDFIVDNPYETREDIMQTYRYMLELPEGIKTNLFLLSFFPGTPLYNKALEDGHIKPYDENSSRFYLKGDIKYQKNYETFLIFLLKHLRNQTRQGKFMPKTALKILGSRPVRYSASMLPNASYNFLNRIMK